ncbi:MAG: type II secretion system protein GspG, partial [Candidatus Binatia bacterium]
MPSRIRCPACGTEQETAETTGACSVCGRALGDGGEAAPAPAVEGEGPSGDAGRADVYDLEVRGSLAEHASALPAEAPGLRLEDLDAIAAGAKRRSSLLALVPVAGLWTIYRSTVHAPREKIVLAAASVVLTAALVLGVRATLPTAEEEHARMHARVRESIGRLRELVEEHRASRGGYPDAETWAASAALADLRFYDPWGRIYLYERPEGADSYRIGTLGRDGSRGGSGEDADVFVSFAPPAQQTLRVAAHRHVILDRAACPAVELPPGAVLEAHGELHVNAGCSFPETGIRMSAGSALRVSEGIRVVGAVNLAGGAASPAPESGAAVVADPLAAVPAP